MGFDVSFHPVDLVLIRERLLPYIMGRSSIDDLVARAVRIAKIRHRANAWGLGALKLGEDLDDFDEHSDDVFPNNLRDSVDLYEEDEFEGSGIIVSPSFADGGRERPGESNGRSLIDSDLHVWGRPFFVTATEPGAVSEVIERYLDAGLESVDAIARAELSRLDPSLEPAVTAELSGDMPPDEDLAQGLSWKLDLLRRCFEARRAGKTSVALPDGELTDPTELLAREVPLAVLEFAASFRPGWMARGLVWPSRLLMAAEVGDAGCFEPPRSLVEPLLRELPDVRFFLEPTITENYMVGGYVPPEKVGTLRAHLAQHRARVLAKAADAGWDEGCVCALQKIDEALADAERARLAFAEATEIYSGIQGIMN